MDAYVRFASVWAGGMEVDRDGDGDEDGLREDEILRISLRELVFPRHISCRKIPTSRVKATWGTILQFCEGYSIKAATHIPNPRATLSIQTSLLALEPPEPACNAVAEFEGGGVAAGALPPRPLMMRSPYPLLVAVALTNSSSGILWDLISVEMGMVVEPITRPELPTETREPLMVVPCPKESVVPSIAIALPLTGTKV